MSWIRRRKRRAFRPEVEGEMETRMLPSGFAGHVVGQAEHIAPREFFAHRPPTHVPFGPRVGIQSFFGGQGARVAVGNGEVFNISVYNPANPLIAGGQIHAFPMSGGRVGLLVAGTTQQSVLSIDPQPFPLRVGTAHDFAYRVDNQTQTLNIGEIIVKSGNIYQILGYHTADLSGPIIVNGFGTVDRIALDSILPGGSIDIGGTLNTLDVVHTANFDGGSGLYVGRDLNWMDIGQDLDFSGGSGMYIARDLGLVAQGAKGSDTGGQGALVHGNVNIAPGSSMNFGRYIDAPFTIYGSLNGYSRVNPTAALAKIVSYGGGTP